MLQQDFINGTSVYFSKEVDSDFDLSIINIETEIQCCEREGIMNFIESECEDGVDNDDYHCKNDIALILFSIEDSTSDSIKIMSKCNESLDDCEAECEEIFSILRKDKIQLTKSTPLTHNNIIEASPTSLCCDNKKSVVIHRPVPKRVIK